MFDDDDEREETIKYMLIAHVYLKTFSLSLVVCACVCVLATHEFLFTYAPATGRHHPVAKITNMLLRVILLHAYIISIATVCPNLIMFNNLRSFTRFAVHFTFFSPFFFLFWLWTLLCHMYRLQHICLFAGMYQAHKAFYIISEFQSFI